MTLKTPIQKKLIVMLSVFTTSLNSVSDLILVITSTDRARTQQTMSTINVCYSTPSLGSSFDFLSDIDMLKQNPAIKVAISPIMNPDESGSVSLAPLYII